MSEYEGKYEMFDLSCVKDIDMESECAKILCMAVIEIARLKGWKPQEVLSSLKTDISLFMKQSQVRRKVSVRYVHPKDNSNPCKE